MTPRGRAPASCVATAHWDSAALAPGSAWAACQAALPFVQLSLGASVAPEAFAFLATAWAFEDVVLSRLRASAVVVRRTREHIRADGADHCCLFACTGGSWIGNVGGRPFAVEAGQVVGLDLSKPFEARALRSHSALALRIARAALAKPLRDPPDLHGRVFAGVGAEMLVDHMRALERRVQTMRADDLATVAKATLGIVGALLTSPPRVADEAAGASTLQNDVLRFVDAHLDEADLSPQRIARDLGIARTTLFRTMQPLGGVAAHVQKRRLEVIHALLRDPAETRSINALASAFGFANPSHFAAAFKKAFGRSARETRALASAAGEAGRAPK